MFLLHCLLKIESLEQEFLFFFVFLSLGVLYDLRTLMENPLTLHQEKAMYRESVHDILHKKDLAPDYYINMFTIILTNSLFFFTYFRGNNICCEYRYCTRFERWLEFVYSGSVYKVDFICKKICFCLLCRSF